MLCRKFNSYI